MTIGSIGRCLVLVVAALTMLCETTRAQVSPEEAKRRMQERRESRAPALEKQNAELRKEVEQLKAEVVDLRRQLHELEQQLPKQSPAPATAPAAARPQARAPAPVPPAAEAAPAAAKAGKAAGGTRTVAFCCDASGSMIDKLVLVKLEVAKAVDALGPDERFSVTFFGEGGTGAGGIQAFEDGALVPATPENKRRLSKWMDGVSATGVGNPIPALELALRERPELLYLVSDGDFGDDRLKAEIRAKLQALNRGRRTRVNTVATVGSHDEPAAAAGVAFMKDLAARHGGQSKRVDQDQLN
jgi:cell division protein FtsB